MALVDGAEAEGAGPSSRASPPPLTSGVRISLLVSAVTAAFLAGDAILFKVSDHGEGLSWPVALLFTVGVRFLAPLAGVLAIVVALTDAAARRRKRWLVVPFVVAILVVLVAAWLGTNPAYQPRGPLG
jgi:4-amino-4-deoxy-L-arabinose transferase-like glycosyltransferase